MLVYTTQADGTLATTGEPQAAPYYFDGAIGPGLARVLVDDVDADGYPDLVLVATSMEGTHSDAIVVWNDHGTLNLDARTAIPMDLNMYYLSSFAVIEADGDPQREIAIATYYGPVFLVDVAARKAGPLVVVDGLLGGEALLAHDFTGDGVDDLLIGSADGLRLHPGVARNP